MAAALLLAAAEDATGVTGRYVRVEYPTGNSMEFRQIEVYSGGRNVVLQHPEMICGTVYPPRTSPAPRRGSGRADQSARRPGQSPKRRYQHATSRRPLDGPEVCRPPRRRV